ncbi:MAG: class I SAM-dependent methyltransferase [Acidobacteria bacterium]|nr:class I SAM-dependent methyltransferase [Acidobacteriota bacterium]
MINQAIQNYWNGRAREYSGPEATTGDVWLRELEIETLQKTLKGLGLPSGARLLDAGCGDGYTTLAVAAALPGVDVTGVDYSPPMLARAHERLNSHPGLAARVRFCEGNVSAIDGSRPFAAAITVRCLINLDKPEDQAGAIRSIAQALEPGGTYVAIENFAEGHDAMNQARAALGLDPIEIRWHNRYFTEPGFREMTEAWFEPPAWNLFASSYYLATRVLYSAYARHTRTAPDYRHPLHELAVPLPTAGDFAPMRLAILRRRPSPCR